MQKKHRYLKDQTQAKGGLQSQEEDLRYRAEKKCMGRKASSLNKQLLIEVSVIGRLCGGWRAVPDGRLLFHHALLMQQDAAAVT